MNIPQFQGAWPRIGIRPTIDGRMGGVRESLEQQTMNMARSAAELISSTLRYPDGTPVECVIAPGTIGRVAESAACAEFFRTQNVGVTITVTPCWCYGSETMDMERDTVKAVWGFNGTERPGAVYLAAVLAAHAQKGLPAFGIYGRHVQDGSDSTIPDDVRAKRTLLSAEIKQFRYINGGLFEDRLPPADFNDKMRQTLLDCCHFDWNKISPTIFGAMFQGVMDKNERRELGAHYTSEENIRKLINPLFLDELWEEFERVKIDTAQLERFHRKMSQLKFLEIITPRLIQFDDCQICLTKGVQNPSRGVHFQKGVCNPLSKPQKYRKPARAMAVAPAGFRFWFYLSNVFSANPLTASTVISQVTSAA